MSEHGVENKIISEVQKVTLAKVKDQNDVDNFS
jgi:hypothetical protein